jgi:hypothetical protein
MLKTAYLLTGLLSTTILASAADYTLHSFKKIQVTDKFWSEGAYAGDFNHDGKMDVVSGPFWYEGPDFKTRHEYSPAKATFKLKKTDGTEETLAGYEGALGKQNAYSDNFLTYVYDFNGDGWDDVIVYGFPGKECFWYENPKGKANADGTEHWVRHKVIDVLDNESPMFGDLTGDGKPEIICNSKGNLGYATADWSNPTAPWTFHPVSPTDAKKWFCYTHGIGFGDVNGDGRVDLLEKDGWWEQPSSLSGDPVWAFHAFPFAPNTGAAQMYAYDVNGDGLNDIITTLNPHGYGLAWYEQYREGGEIKFKQHVFMGKEPKDNKYGVKFSQPHGIDLVDVDGDGLKDIVTGKRFWAHGPAGDVEPNAAAVLYWFKLVRNADKTVDFIPYLVDDNSGVGTEVAALKVSGGKNPDIVVGNKRGTFVFVHETKIVSKEEWEKAQPKPLAGN